MTRMMMIRNGGNRFVAVQIKKKQKKRNKWKYQLKKQLTKTKIKKMIIKKDDDDECNDEEKVEFFVRAGKNKRFKYY